jgi:hypothetical protein
VRDGARIPGRWEVVATEVVPSRKEVESSGMSGAKVLSTDLKNANSLADVLNAVEKARAAAQPLGFHCGYEGSI